MKQKILLAAVALTASSLASAQWYGGASIGSSNASISDSAVAVTGATASTVSKKESDTGAKLQLGYQFSPYFAVEGGYVNLGKLSATRNVTAPAVGTNSAELKADGWNLVAVGIAPINDKFSLLGKVGGIYSTTTRDSAVTGAVTLTGEASSKKSELNLTYGIGAQYAINKSVSVRVEAESFVGLRSSDAAAKGDVNLYSVGVIVKF